MILAAPGGSSGREKGRRSDPVKQRRSAGQKRGASSAPKPRALQILRRPTRRHALPSDAPLNQFELARLSRRVTHRGAAHL